MREDLSWRQTFMKILLSYYYLDIKEPVEVQVKTNEYRQDNNDLFNFLEENLEYKKDSLLQVKDVVLLHTGKAKVATSISNKYKKEIEKYIKEKHKNVKWENDVVRVLDKTHRGWKNICIKDEI